ncbi:MAG: alpha/beta hydrolase [Scytolyngbya sp. HA4215-MV1]|nr:alpha/beta hydrolase [Scytolyngbya sp. HA4215-MV1]
MGIPLVALYQFKPDHNAVNSSVTNSNSKQDLPGFFAVSTAPTNIEEKGEENPLQAIDPTLLQGVTFLPDPQHAIERIAASLYAKNDRKDERAELVIAIHGYNMQIGPVKDWYQEIWQYARNNQIGKNSVFLGYRWPSESMKSLSKHLLRALQSLPVLLSFLLFGGIFAALLIALFSGDISFLFVLALFVPTLVIALILLRIVLYFRDNYRAAQFGVPDLVELIRQLDQGLIDYEVNQVLAQSLQKKYFEQHPDIDQSVLLKIFDSFRRELLKEQIKIDWKSAEFRALLQRVQQSCQVDCEDDLFLKIAEDAINIAQTEYQKAIANWDEKRIKLSFIAHSMGAFVTTNAVRILSDVFDSRSIGTLDSDGKAPPSDIGRAFCLGRLVLASPDIPANAIAEGRANFLRSSLRRFSEAYLFSNEGDLALRVASTAANYFSFPTSERIHGHRLGNVTVSPLDRKKDPKYGVVNATTMTTNPPVQLANYLEINKLLSSVSLKELQPEGDTQAIAIADLFTYFDCTNYVDYKYQKGQRSSKKQAILSYRLDQFPLLNFIVYPVLMISWLLGRIDVHGGYFQGEFTRKAVYELAFMGFRDFLVTLNPQLAATSLPSEKSSDASQPPQAQALFQKFSAICVEKQIQVAFSPERYRVNIAGDSPKAVRQEILTPPQ